MDEELTEKELGVLLTMINQRLRYENKRAYTEPDLGTYKRRSLAQIAEKLERMKLAS